MQFFGVRSHILVFLKLWLTAVRQVVRDGAQAVSKDEALQKWNQTLNEWKIRPYMSVLKLPLLGNLQQKVSELVLSMTSCPSVIILENILNLCIEKAWLW
jgi:hypothetical protein